MHPKPPNPRTGKSGWLGRRSTRLKSLTAVGALTLGVAGAAFAAAGPASADPAFNFVVVGSDTTQNIMDGFAGTVSEGIIGSYDSVNPVTQTADEIITPGVAGAGGSQQNCSFTRPNGSGQGFNALDASYNPTTTLTQLAVPPQPGCIAFSRSSSGPGSVGTSGPGALDSSGNLVYIPFALDAVTDATGPSTAGQMTTTQCVSTTTGCTNVVNGFGTITFTVPVTNITHANLFTLADLKTLYDSCGTVSEGGVTYNPGTATTGQQQIDLYLPQGGSGTFKFWVATLGIPSTLPACDHQTILTGPAAGIIDEEHDGTAVASDANGITVISIAQWIAQSNGVQLDRRHGAIEQAINGVQPIVSGALNGSFPIVREIYNVASYPEVVNSSGDTSFSPLLNGLLATTNSELCQSGFTISNYGFAALPSPSTPDACGATTNGLRVQETNTGPS